MRSKASAAFLAALLVLTGAVAFAQAGSVAAATHRTRAPSICSRSFNPYKQHVAVLHRCKDKILWLRRVSLLPGGGKAYSYGDYTQIVPPAHFNPLKASDKQLQEYGLPTRRQLGREWYTVMRHYHHTVPPTRYVVEIPGVQAPAPTRVTGSAGRACGPPDCNDHWSGYYVTGHSYNEVDVIWTEPSFVAAGCSGDAFVQWAGIGGWNTGTLGQDGTAFNISNVAAHGAWIETDINNVGSIVAVNLTATRNQNFFASTTWDATNKWFSFFMQNDASGGGTYSGHGRAVSSPDLSTAEVISERPEVNGQFAELSDYQNVSVQGATGFWDTSSNGFDHLSHSDIFMEFPAGKVLSDPGTINSQSNFTPIWQDCG